MKTLLISAFILIITSVNVGAQYIEGQESNHEDGVMTITTMSVIDEPRICTMEYAPVCAEVQVQCFKAPCPPITQTFGNACGAGDNPVLFEGECSSYMNDSLYKKYESKRGVVEKIISKYNASTLMKLDEILDQRIKMVKLSRIAVEMQKERITKYSFIKSVINTQLSAK